MTFEAAIKYRPFWESDQGFSEEAREIRDAVETVRRHSNRSIILGWRASLIDQTMEMHDECSSPGWDGYDAEPLTTESLSSVRRFLESLPDYIQQPEIVPEPTGGIAFEWDKGRDVIFSVTLNGDRYVYAGILGDHKHHGEGTLTHELPEPVEVLLARYFPRT
ncbi:MAG: hypothetical protein A2Z34_05440 [Planctomycetes bacterium RBG_16_59_8]|nr:MAG: hypothetical protein A2Z34_05440 [Planctomycetes bacterium RBG_16_59_8]